MDKRALTVWSLERVKFVERDALICSERSANSSECTAVTSERSANSVECSAIFISISQFQSVPYDIYQKTTDRSGDSGERSEHSNIRSATPLERSA